LQARQEEYPVEFFSLTVRHIFQRLLPAARFDLTYSEMKRIKRRITACILMISLVYAELTSTLSLQSLDYLLWRLP